MNVKEQIDYMIQSLQLAKSEIEYAEKYLQCSVCGYERRDVFIPKHKPPYCEECGAKMDGGQN